MGIPNYGGMKAFVNLWEETNTHEVLKHIFMARIANFKMHLYNFIFMLIKIGLTVLVSDARTSF